VNRRADRAHGLLGVRADRRAVGITVLHDAAHPSRLVVGQLPGETARAPLPACDTLRNQPCRPDPLASGAVAAPTVRTSCAADGRRTIRLRRGVRRGSVRVDGRLVAVLRGARRSVTLRASRRAIVTVAGVTTRGRRIHEVPRPHRC